MKKKVLALLTVVTMVFGTGGVLPDSSKIFSTLISARAYTCGYFGYSILDDGTVNITKYYGTDSKVTIPGTIDGKIVTRIDDGAFYECKNLTSITIPDSITSIGAAAFRGCESLTSITIPDGVTSISNYTFYLCTSLKSISLPDSIINIDANAFDYCTSLTSITIPESVKIISDYAFSQTSLTSINVDNNNPYYCSIDGVLFNKNKRILKRYPAGKDIESYLIPDSVISIGYDAFKSCTRLTSITIPESVTSIGGGAFSYCTSLTSIMIPNSVTSIGSGAFQCCTSLTGITIPNNVTNIFYAAFNSCINLTNIMIPDSVTSIDDYAFCDCTNLENITIPDSVTSIGDYAFYYCPSLESITIPKGVSSIGSKVFGYDGTEKIQHFKIYCYKNSAGEQYAIDYEFDYELIEESKSIINCSITLGTTSYTYDGTEQKPSVTVKDGSTTLTSGTDYTASYSNNINAGTGKVTITGIGKYTGSVTKIFTINTKSISGAAVTLSQTSYTYDGNEKKPTVTVKDGSKVLSNGTDYTVSYSNNKNVGTAIVTVTGKGNYSGISDISFNIISNNGDILYDEEYGRWYVIDDKGNNMPLTCNYDQENDVWYAPNGKKVNVLYCDDVNYSNHEFPDRVAYIVLPNGEAMLLKNYGYYNTIYETIDGYKVSAIGNNFDVPWANDGNYGLIDPNNENSGRKITIPDYVTYCGPSSMATWGLDELQLSNNLLCIEDSAFMVYDGTLMNNSTLNALNLNEGLKYIGDKAFLGYSALTSVSIPSSVKHIGNYAFGYCTDIEKLQEDMESHIDDESFDWRSSEKYYKKVGNFTIYGYKGTEAENYANKNGFNFIALDKEDNNPKTYIRGDVNLDKKLNVTDITKIAAHIKGKRLLDDRCRIVADVNDDGKINITDINKVAAHIKGKRLLDLTEIPFPDEEDVGEIFFSPVDPDHIATAEDGISMYADNEILVVAAEGVTKAQIEELAKQYDAEIVGYIEKTGDYQWKLNKREITEIIQELKNNSLLEEVSLNYIAQIKEDIYNCGIKYMISSIIKNDDFWGHEIIYAPFAWEFMENISISEENYVRVGIIDNAFYKHEDLGFAQIFDNSDPDPNDETDNHGTHVAGTFAAKGDNTEGFCGIYPYGNNRLYGVSAVGTLGNHSENPGFWQSVMTLKIEYSELIFRNVKVINQSQGFNLASIWNGTDSYFKQYLNLNKSDYPTLDSLFNYISNQGERYKNSSPYQLASFLNRCYNKGFDFVIVCSAGNDSGEDANDPGKHYDAKANSWLTLIENDSFKDIYNRIIVVGSVSKQLRVSSFSNTGTRVDIYAPGEQIMSTIGTKDYKKNFSNGDWSGTSMASPHVAGVAANVWTINNNLTGAQVKEIICRSTLDNVVLENNKGVVDAAKAAVYAAKEDGKGNKQANDGVAFGWVFNNTDGSDYSEQSLKNGAWERVNNCTISVRREGESEVIQNTSTDSYGHFEIMLPEGVYIITASHPDFGEQEIFPLTISSNQVHYCQWIVFNGKFTETISKIPGQEPVRTLLSNAEYAWTAYDHPNFDTSPGYDKHIIIDGDNIKMDGYLEAGFKDFLFVDDKNSKRKIFELDFQRDQTSPNDTEYNWHSMYGGGFLFNTAIDEEENTISGYYILITQNGVELFKVDNMALDEFRDCENMGEKLKTFTFDNKFAKHHIKIDVSESSVSLYDGENLIIDNYTLNDNYGNGFGPITSHTSHCCEQRSYFTFSNITMQTM